MAKSIKKIYRVLLITVSILILVLLMAFLLLRTPSVQTWIVNKVTSKINENIETPVSIGGVHYSFFNRLLVTDLLLLDQNTDTLIFTSKAIVGIRRLGIKSKSIRLSKVSLYDPQFNIVTDSAGISNLSWFLSQFEKDEELEDSNEIGIIIDQIQLTGGRFTLKTPEDPEKPYSGGVNFSNLSVNNLNATIEDFKIDGDTTLLSIYRASFTEAGGFTVDRFSCDMSVSKSHIGFNAVELSTPGSFIKGDEFSISFDGPEAFRNFGEEVRMRFIIDRSIISPADLSGFVPSLSINTGEVVIAGRITGTLSQLRGRDLKIEAGELTIIECDFDLSGLPDIENTYIFVEVNNMVTQMSELSQLGLVDHDKLPARLDEEVGRISFRGTFSGFTTDFVTYGKLITRAGALSTDISVKPIGNNLFHYSGSLDGTGLDVGKLTGKNELLGLADFNVDIDGNIRSVNDFTASLSGTITQAEINNYLYSNINLNGQFSEKTWDGSVSIMDENLELEFLGTIDFQNEKPEFDFSLNIPEARLFDLNIDKADTNSTVSLIVTANFKGDNIDNIAGEVKLLNSTITRNEKSLVMYDGSIEVWADNGTQAIDLNTDFISASLRGSYNFSTLSYSFKKILADLLPSRIDEPAPLEDIDENSFDLKVVLHETEKANDFLNTKLSISTDTRIDIKYLLDNKIDLTIVSDEVSYSNFKLTGLRVGTIISGNESKTEISSSSFLIGEKPEFKGFEVSVNTTPDIVNLDLKWDNKDVMVNKGAVSMLTKFSKEGEEKVVEVAVDSSVFYIMNDRWKIHPGKLTFHNGLIDVENLFISSEEDHYHISGKISESSQDTLLVNLESIDLGIINNIYDQKSDGKLKLAIGGSLSGNILLTGVLKDIMVETDNIVIDRFRMMDHEYGSIYINSLWDNYLKTASLTLFNDFEGTKAIDVTGSFSPDDKDLQINAVATRLPIEILNPLLSSFASGIKGYASGSITLNSKKGKPVLNGSMYVDEGSMMIDYLQTQYSFSDSVIFDDAGIKFRNIEALDERGNSLMVDGAITHTFFDNLGIDLTFTPNQAMVMNTREKDNEMFYGTAFATGVISIRSSENNMAFDISARTDRNTRFFVPMNSSLSVEEYSFITFIGTDTLQQANSDKENKQLKESEGNMSMNIDLEVTPDAEVQLVLDSKAGDVMRGRGSGRLNISLTPRGDFSISGDYVIMSGDYLFTLGNLVNKRFSVTEGSRISWNGEITEAEIDIKAVYKLEASLYELLQIEELRERIPVECHLHMTERLMNPVIGFDIILPTADEQTRSYLRSAINTDDEMSRQFLYLLVMNRFYPDPAFYAGGSVPNGSSAGTSAIGSTTTEMLTSQVSNWLSQISNDFDVGFVYRPGNEISAQEVEVALSTQLLNDRVRINSNIDVGGNQNASAATNITGVFDLEYTINERLKLKFFNRSNDNILYETAPYTQGLGVFVRYDFDNLKRLFSKSGKSEGKKEKKPKVPRNRK
jgi:hypothetical protein